MFFKYILQPHIIQQLNQFVKTFINQKSLPKTLMKFWNKIRNQMFISGITRTSVNINSCTKKLMYMVDQVKQFVLNNRNILF